MKFSPVVLLAVLCVATLWIAPSGCATAPDGSVSLDLSQVQQAIDIAMQVYTFAVEQGIIKPDEPQPDRASHIDKILDVIIERIADGHAPALLDNLEILKAAAIT